MSRWLALALLLLPCPGCGSAPQESSKSVPVTSSSAPAGDEKAATKPPRAIATH